MIDIYNTCPGIDYLKYGECLLPLMQTIVCPICTKPIAIGLFSCICEGGHKFPVIDGILDLLPDTNDSNLLNEQEHWNDVADKGKMKVAPNKYFSDRIGEDYCKVFEESVRKAWSGNYHGNIDVADIGCGSGSVITYLKELEFHEVNYVGIDVSMKIMRIPIESREIFPDNWKIRFIRASANTGLFRENSLDMIVSASALHHLNVPSVMKWVSKSLKPNGLFILHEPSSNNPFAKIGRKFVGEFHTKGESPLYPGSIKQIAYNHNLTLMYEKGLHYLTGSLQYLFGIVKFPFPFIFCVYHISRFLDSLIVSPSLNYSFIHVYKK